MFWVLCLLSAWAVANVSCARPCLASMRAGADDTDVHAHHSHHCHRLTLYEAAFLSGGPARVADLTLVSMARRRRLLLAHTGWATVVDPDGRDEMERSVIGATGPGGQSRIAPVRRTAAAAESVRRLSDRLVAAGLAVPDATRASVADAVAQVRGAASLAVCGLGTLTLLLPSQGFEEQRVLVTLWFALRAGADPQLSCHRAGRGASLSAVGLTGGGAGAEGRGRAGRGRLRGPCLCGCSGGAVESPELRAAFEHR